MVKKQFIDKKKSVTYNLVFRSTEDADAAPARMLAEAGVVGMGRVDEEAVLDSQPGDALERRYPPGHPLAWLEAEQSQEAMTEERRRELVEFGFPDDGYDYLRHMRTLGHGAASLEGLRAPAVAAGTSGSGVAPDASPLGPSVFLPAAGAAPPQEDDVALFDASGLRVMQPAGEDSDLTGMMGGVTAFSRPRRAQDARGADRRELEELEAAMAELEQEDDENVAGAEAAGVAAAEGLGDLLDDFILAATEQDAADAAAAAAGGEQEGGEDEDEAWSSDEEYSGSEGDGAAGGGGRGCAGSIASTYWREERGDRKALLGVIDERFEALAVQYDEDEIGDMEESAEAGDIAGHADVAQFDALMDEFLDQHGATTEGGGEGQPGARAPRVHSALKAELEAHGFDDDDAGIAREHARAAIHRAEAEEAAGRGGFDPADLERVEMAPEERWDCETVLSLRSNLYNHPATITEPPGRRGPPPHVIRLNKAGLPAGVLAPSKARGAAAAAPAPAAAPAQPPMERRKDETPEEKRARKEAVKSAKREARVSKKELKGIFKDEAAKAQRRAATAQVQPAVLL